MTKVDVISGFLGAGKTTLIKKMLKEALSGQKIVLIENEFGEIGIDGGFMQEAGIQVTEMNSGCICCSLVGDFGEALKQVLTQYHPDRILIEPSGVGKLSDVIRAVEEIAQQVPIVLNATVAVVDAGKCNLYMKNFGEFFNNQVESAKAIVLSRTQKISQEKMDACVSILREHNTTAPIFTTPWDEIGGAMMLDVIEKAPSLAQELLAEEVCPECGHVHLEEQHHHGHDHACEHDHDHNHDCGHHHHHDHECGHIREEGECSCEHHHHSHHHGHDADEIFASWGAETSRKYAEKELRQALSQLSQEGTGYGVILRAKGIVPDIAGGWFHFDLVPGEFEVRKGPADYTGRLCVIGSKLQEDELKKLFRI
mgnify:CR=1 FL=1